MAKKAATCAAFAERVWPLIEMGRIKPAAETRFAIEDVAEAHRHLASGEALGKLILTWA